MGCARSDAAVYTLLLCGRSQVFSYYISTCPPLRETAAPHRLKAVAGRMFVNMALPSLRKVSYFASAFAFVDDMVLSFTVGFAFGYCFGLCFWLVLAASLLALLLPLLLPLLVACVFGFAFTFAVGFVFCFTVGFVFSLCST